MQKILVPIFTFIWRRRLKQTDGKKYDKVIKVRGWRTATIDRVGGQREVVTFLFKWENSKWE